MFFSDRREKFDTGKMKITSERWEFGHRSPTGGGASPYTEPAPRKNLGRGTGSGIASQPEEKN